MVASVAPAARLVLPHGEALQKLFAGLCEPAQSTVKNPAAYPATFINLP
jgi:hypothetical protein